jgi:hypothetical protein
VVCWVTAVPPRTTARKPRIPWKTGGAGATARRLRGGRVALAEKRGGTAVPQRAAAGKHGAGGKTKPPGEL